MRSFGNVRKTIAAVLPLLAWALPVQAQGVAPKVGAVRPDDAKVADTRPWAFRPPVRVTPPKVKHTAWVKNPIDAFVLSRLEAKGLQPAPSADKITLIRRVTFDLTGLPPTPQEVDAFLADKSPDAYARVVDRLLASPRYGERWARHWLDLARYAESEGFKSDEMRPNAWRYRDYVIQSLNADKPYDRFIREQLAGDELFPEDREALVATGFCRHWADESNAQNLLLRRQEILNDITDTTGTVFLGLTFGCARCHDHKYDPIPQRDYYRLQAFFAAVRPRDDLVLLSAEKRAEIARQQAEWEHKTADLRAERDALEQPVRHTLYLPKYRRFPEDVQAAIDTTPEKRTALQWILFHKVEPQIMVSESEVAAAMNSAKPEVKARWQELTRQIDAFQPLKPAAPPLAIGITDVGPDAPKTYTLATGVYDKPLQEVQPGFLRIVTAQAPVFASPRPDTTGRRSVLANWIASPDNPLTARVLVNRVWQHHFGRGLVATPDDFGAQGERPTHPELLDWLAVAFVSPPIRTTETQRHRDHTEKSKEQREENDPQINADYHRLQTGEEKVSRKEIRGGIANLDCTEGAALLVQRKEDKRAEISPSPVLPFSAYGCGWRLKALHRLIVLSAAYQQADTPNPVAAKVDPENTLLWRFRRQRLEGEAVRDAILAVSGELNPKMGGPSIMPDLPAGITTRGYWHENADPKERNRRSVYVFVKRNLRYPFFEAFDMPDTHEPCGRRMVTTTAPQALMLLNDARVLSSAQAFAARVRQEAGPEPAQQIVRAYRLAFSRMPDEGERRAALSFLAKQVELLRGNKPQGTTSSAPSGAADVEQAALTDLCHALLNANEFLYID